MDHDRRDANTPATRRATGIMPVAVSLPTATPASVTSRFAVPRGSGNSRLAGDPHVPGAGVRRAERHDHGL